ncbi:MAG: serpin family protein [Labedaea sp.]
MVTDRAHLAFTLALHRAAAPDSNRDACWSPYSVAGALGLVAAGARGVTRDELAGLLLGDKAGDLNGLGRLLGEAAELEAPGAGAEQPVLAVANTLWADDSIDIRDSFVAELSRWLPGSVRSAPFRVAPDKARELINTDVAETTRNLIPELVPAGAIGVDTVAALVNALYLKCAWRNRFAEDATVPRAFHTPSGRVEVPTMELTETVGYGRTAGWQVVELVATGGVRAVILLPDGDLAEAESRLDADTLAALLGAPRPTWIRLRLPRVNVASQTELTAALNRLGVRTMFGNHADLRGISPDPLAVQAVLHESVLKLDEQGLEGAAATAVTLRVLGMMSGEPVPVDVDRPFLLLVRHGATSIGYFLARVVTPSA